MTFDYSYTHLEVLNLKDNIRGSLYISTNFAYKAGHILELYSVLAQVPFDIGKTKLNI